MRNTCKQPNTINSTGEVYAGTIYYQNLFSISEAVQGFSCAIITIHQKVLSALATCSRWREPRLPENITLHHDSQSGQQPTQLHAMKKRKRIRLIPECYITLPWLDTLRNTPGHVYKHYLACYVRWLAPNPANTRHWTDVVLMLVRRQRRRTNIKTTLVQCLVLAGKQSPLVYHIICI